MFMWVDNDLGIRVYQTGINDILIILNEISLSFLFITHVGGYFMLYRRNGGRGSGVSDSVAATATAVTADSDSGGLTGVAWIINVRALKMLPSKWACKVREV